MHQGGIALPAVIFMLVVLATLLAAGVTMMSQASQGMNLELRGARALAAARAGAEWGTWMVNDPLASRSPSATAIAACASNTALPLPSPLDEFVVDVQCTRFPATGEYDEGGLKVAAFQLIVTASSGPGNSADRVERRIETRVVVCKNPGGQAPRYPC
jgi:hypothetical protein